MSGWTRLTARRNAALHSSASSFGSAPSRSYSVSMAMLSLSVSCIHLELSAAKSPKEQALVLSMILFQRGRKMTELCATRMELDYAFVEFPQLLRAGYRIEGPGRYKTMTLKPHELIRRLLMHVLPNGFHRISHCGLLASGTKTQTIGRDRHLMP